MPTAEYHLKQAQLAAGMALAEPDKSKSARLNLLALEHFDKAEKAKARAGKRPSRRSRRPSGKDDGDLA